MPETTSETMSETTSEKGSETSSGRSPAPIGSEMLAAVAHPGKRYFELEQLPVPEIGDSEVLVRVEAVGLNTGMLLNWRDLNRMSGVIGIHAAGTVAAAGALVDDVAVGDRVHVDPIRSCGRCEMCLDDRRVSCRRQIMIGGHNDHVDSERYLQGALAEYWRVPARQFNHLPENLGWPAASKLGVVGTSYNSLRSANLPLNATVVLTGATGANGGAVCLSAPLFGVRRIIAVGRSTERLEATRELVPDIVEPLGLDRLPDGWEANGGLTDEILARTGGAGADAVIDFLPGAPHIVEQAIAGLRMGGRARLYAGNTERLSFRYVDTMPINQAQIDGGRGHGRRDLLEILQHVRAGRLDPSPLVTHTFPLTRINEAVDLLDNREDTRTWFVSIEP